MYSNIINMFNKLEKNKKFHVKFRHVHVVAVLNRGDRIYV